MYHININQKKAGVAVLISDKINSKANRINRDKDSNFIMMDASICLKYIKYLNLCYI